MWSDGRVLIVESRWEVQLTAGRVVVGRFINKEMRRNYVFNLHIRPGCAERA